MGKLWRHEQDHLFSVQLRSIIIPLAELQGRTRLDQGAVRSFLTRSSSKSFPTRACRSSPTGAVALLSPMKVQQRLLSKHHLFKHHNFFLILALVFLCHPWNRNHLHYWWCSHAVIITVKLSHDCTERRRRRACTFTFYGAKTRSKGI